MTRQQEERCHQIIHSHAVACTAANAIPIPGLNIAADITTLTTMTMALGAVFGESVTKEYAKNLVIVTLKNSAFQIATQSIIKLIPVVGWVVGPMMSLGMIEQAGWELAKRLSNGV